jgi:hypothetical protein
MVFIVDFFWTYQSVPFKCGATVLKIIGMCYLDIFYCKISQAHTLSRSDLFSTQFNSKVYYFIKCEKCTFLHFIIRH